MSRKYWRGGMAGTTGDKQGDWQTGLVINTTGSAAAVVDSGGSPNKVAIPVEDASAINTNDYVTINGSSYYDGTYRVLEVIDNTQDLIVIEHSYIAEDFTTSVTITGSNWEDDNGMPCAIPEAGDEVFFTNRALVATSEYTKHVYNNHWSCFDGINRDDTGGLELASLVIDSTYNGDIGIDAENTISYLHLSIADSGIVIIKGPGRFYIKCAGATKTESSNIPTLLIDTNVGYVNIASDVNSASYASKWDVIKCINVMYLTIVDNTIVGDIYTYKNRAVLDIGENCINVNDNNTPISLHLGLSNVYNPRAVKTQIDVDGAITFGASKAIITNA